MNTVEQVEAKLKELKEVSVPKIKALIKKDENTFMTKKRQETLKDITKYEKELNDMGLAILKDRL